MRILTISEVYPSPEQPQYGVFIKQQVDELKKLGNDVDVLRPMRGSRNGQMEQASWADTTVYSMEYRVIRYELFLKQAAHAFYTQLKRLVKQNNYDVLAVHITSDTVLKIATDIGRELKIAVVAHYHGLNVWREYVSRHRTREGFFARRRAKMLKETQAIVGVSDKVCKVVRERITDVPVYTVYNGVETELFYPQEEKEDAFTIIGVGNLIPIKGFRFLIDAFAQIYQDDPSARLSIIGDGIERTALEAQVRSLGLDGAVTFFGKLPYEQVAERMRRSHLFVLPSYYEALGCVYLEAMACGLPTIGVRGLGIDEIIRDGENGLLVEPQDVDSLYSAIQAVMNDREMARRLSANGRDSALRYTWRASAEALDQIYQETVAR